MLTEIEIRQAIEFESKESSVLSVYLNVDSHRRTPEKYRLALRALLDAAEGAAVEDKRKVQQYVELGYNWQGRGLILFSCAAKNFWWAQSVTMPVQDQVFVSFRPYVHQLAGLLETYQRLGVVHVDQVGARLYLFDMGNLIAVEGHLGEAVHVHRSGGWAAPRYQRREAEIARQNLSAAAELAEEFYRENQTRRLILAGTEKNVARFRGLLSNRLRQMVIGEFPADANASPSELEDEASRIALDAGEAADRTLADEVITLAHKGGNGVLGLADTLNAVQTGRAQQVILLNHFSQPAYRFVHSRYVVLDPEEAASSGSGEQIEKLPDAVDSVLRHAMLQGIGVAILDEHPALAQAGSIGALTRY